MSINKSNYLSKVAREISAYIIPAIADTIANYICGSNPSDFEIGFYELVDLVDIAEIEDCFKGACLGGNRLVVRTLLDKGVDPNKWIVHAYHSKLMDIVSMLIAAGARKYCVAMAAITNSDISSIKMFLELGLDPNIIIEEAAFYGELDIVELLLEKGADIDLAIEGVRHPEDANMLAYINKKKIENS